MTPLKKPRRSAAADFTKRNVSEMGMFFLSKPAMEATEVFPKCIARLVCVGFTCKSRECRRIALLFTLGRLGT